jgi:hypothetical protein
VSTGDRLLDGLLYAASWLFLLGVMMVVLSAVPALARRYSRVFLHGFLLSVASLALALVAALVLG